MIIILAMRYPLVRHPFTTAAASVLLLASATACSSTDETAAPKGDCPVAPVKVTVSVDQVSFREPIEVGELVTLLAMINHTGSSSMEVGIKVMAEEIRSERIRHVNSCYFTMVAVDEHGRPAPVPPREPEDEDARRRQASAMLRRQLRREFDERFAQIRGRPA